MQTNTKSAFSGSLFDFEASAEIIVEAAGSLTALSGDVTLSSVIDQNRSLIDLFGDALAGINVINVKVGNADIIVKGKITARNNVNLTAKANVTIKASNSVLASAFVPLAVVVSVTDVNIDIKDNAVIVAECGSVKANADSKVSLIAEATTGKLPISLAVAVGVNDAHVKMSGNSKINANQDVELVSGAITSVEAKANRGALAGNVSVYITAEVVVQNASAEVTDQAAITAGGNVKVSSTANQNAMAVASSAKNDNGAGAGGGTSTKSGMDGIKGMFGDIAAVFAANAKGAIADLLNGIGQKFGGKTYKINTAKTENGAVTAPTSANAHEIAASERFEEGVTYYTCDSAGRYTQASVRPGDEMPKKPVYYVKTEPVKFTVTPDKGYTVEKIEIKYLLSGSDSYKTFYWMPGSAYGIASGGDGNYTFQMPEAEVTITVKFKEGSGNDGNGGDGTDINISDLLDESLDSAQEDDDEIVTEDSTKTDPAPLDITVKYGDGAYAKVDQEEEGGIFRTDTTYYLKNDDNYTRLDNVSEGDTMDSEKEYYVRTGGVMLEVGKVDAGKKINVIVSPAKNKVVKTVTATYKTMYVPASGQIADGVDYYLLIDGDYVKQDDNASLDSKNTYYVLDQANQREVVDIIEKVDGKYIYKIPHGVTWDAMEGGWSIIFSAEFGDPDPTAQSEQTAAGSEAQTAQSAGALAAGVNINNNKAEISTTGKIKAGGVVTVNADASAIAAIKADGTAVGPDAKNEDKDPEERPEVNSQTAAQTIIPYTVYIEPAKGVSLMQVGGSDAAKGIFVFQAISLDPTFEDGEGKVTFKYTKADGTAGTGTAAYDDSNGRYTVDLSALEIKAGTQVSITAVSLDAGMPIEGEYLVANTMVIHSTQNGTITHASGKPGSAVYAFKVTPAVGYAVKGKADENDS
ncbi:MAG: hypothetical protein IJ107_06485, partial [Lachnospiraceae bacterium]|nr:hypothetical protein [Lachnospiraceae bacterium]